MKIYKNKNINIHYEKIKEQNILFFDLSKTNLFASYFLRLLEFKDWHYYDKSGGLLDLKEYLKWFKLINDGLDYNELYYGMYISHKLIKDFFKKYFDDLSRSETIIYKQLQKFNLMDGNNSKSKTHFIIINRQLCEDDKINYQKVYEHEFSHLLFEIDKEYKNMIENTYTKLNKKYKQHIIRLYNLNIFHESFYADEWAAEIHRTRNVTTSLLSNVNKKNITKIQKYFNYHFKQYKDLIWNNKKNK